MLRPIALVVLTTWAPLLAHAQLDDSDPASAVTVRGIPLAGFGSVDAADFDGDGDQDLVVIGQRADGTSVTGLYLFQGRIEEPVPRQAARIVAVYSQFSFPVRKMVSGQVVWGDVDGDGDPDLLMTGTAVDDAALDPVYSPATDIFQNDGRTLNIRSTASLPALSESRGAWGDLDGDGDLDLALAGRRANGQAFSGVFLHDGRFGFTPLALEVPSLIPSDLVWGDFDGDQDLDLILAGRDGETPRTVYLRNTGSGSLEVVDMALPAPYFASLAAGDFDRDGFDDLFISGGVLSPDILRGSGQLFRGSGSGFIPVDEAFDALFAGDAQWGDFDADGDLDLLIGGVRSVASADDQSLAVYEQTDGGFRQAASYRGVLFGPTLWFDYNQDGVLDILASGFQGDLLVNLLFEF